MLQNRISNTNQPISTTITINKSYIPHTDETQGDKYEWKFNDMYMNKSTPSYQFHTASNKRFTWLRNSLK